MARKRTRKHTRKTPRKTTKVAARAKPKRNTGKVPGRGFAAVAGGMLAGGVALVVGALRPVGPLVARVSAWAWTSRGMRRGTGVVAGLVVLASLAVVMEYNLRKETRYMLDPARIELSSEPAWAKGTLARQIKDEIENDLRAELADLELTSAFDSAILDVISERLLRNAWVHSVQRIERRFPTDGQSYSRLLPVLEVRRPVLAIETRDAYVLVDGQGVVLPLSVSVHGNELRDFRAGMNGPLRIARGVTGNPPAPGQEWNNEQVRAALSMESVVRRARLDAMLPIEWIELVGVPHSADERGRVHYPPDGAVVLVPHPSLFEDTRVIWGRPPVHASTPEPAPNEKLDRLRERLAQTDQLPGTRIDLRHRA